MSTRLLGSWGRGIRLRFTVLYATLFLVSGAGLLDITVAVFLHNTRGTVRFRRAEPPCH
jgi:hypothetical protein